MKYFHLFFCMFIVGSISAQSAEEKDNKSIISWKTDYLLTGGDFQGDPGKNVYARAQTSYKIENRSYNPFFYSVKKRTPLLSGSGFQIIPC